jgi:hypothetical protein
MDRQAVRQISEADWKLFRQLSALALERFCEGVLSEVGRLASGNEKSAHQRYLAVLKRLQRRDKEWYAKGRKRRQRA